MILGFVLGLNYTSKNIPAGDSSIPNTGNIVQLNESTNRFSDQYLGVAFEFPKDAVLQSGLKYDLMYIWPDWRLRLENQNGIDAFSYGDRSVSVYKTMEDGTKFNLNFSNRNIGYPATVNTKAGTMLIAGKEQRYSYEVGAESEFIMTGACSLTLTIKGGLAQVQNILDTIECI